MLKISIEKNKVLLSNAPIYQRLILDQGCWKAFLSSLKNRQPSAVRITQITVEGDPIFYELSYDRSHVRYTFDNSKDAFGADLGRPSTRCKNVEKKKMAQDREGYVLGGCDNAETGDTFWFAAS